MKHIIKAFHNSPLVPVKDRNFMINSLIDQDPATPPELLREVVEELTKITDISKATKIFGEEDRGGFLAALMAYEHNLPLAMVKWNPSGLEGQVCIDFRNAYTHGKMYANGLEPNDKVLLVEDLVDSGGTIIGMLKMLQKEKIEVVDVIVVAEKVEYKGIEAIKKATGVDVKTLIKFSSTGDKSKVVWIHDQGEVNLYE